MIPNHASYDINKKEMSIYVKLQTIVVADSILQQISYSYSIIVRELCQELLRDSVVSLQSSASTTGRSTPSLPGPTAGADAASCSDSLAGSQPTLYTSQPLVDFSTDSIHSKCKTPLQLDRNPNCTKTYLC